VTATNSANPTSTATISATVALVSGLTVTVTTDKTSYTRGKTVAITVGVNADGSPVANVSVTVTITKANGTVVKQTALTGTSGTTVSKLRLKQTDLIGTYQVRADASLNGITGSATGSFTVQEDGLGASLARVTMVSSHDTGRGSSRSVLPLLLVVLHDGLRCAARELA